MGAISTGASLKNGHTFKFPDSPMCLRAAPTSSYSLAHKANWQL